MPCFRQPPGQGRRQLSINDKSHATLWANSHEHRMIHFPGCVFQASTNVFGLKIWKIPEDFRLTHTGGKKVKHILDANAHAPDARPSATLAWIKSDSVRVLHGDQCIELNEFFQADNLD
jgi:hypothetical protein